VARPATEASVAAAVRPVMAARVARALRAAKVAEAHSGVIEVEISAAAGGHGQEEKFALLPLVSQQVHLVAPPPCFLASGDFTPGGVGSVGSVRVGGSAFRQHQNQQDFLPRWRWRWQWQESLGGVSQLGWLL
jgi:hypothetical protein